MCWHENECEHLGENAHNININLFGKIMETHKHVRMTTNYTSTVSGWR